MSSARGVTTVALVAAASALLAVSCTKPTKITLVVTSDLPCSELKGVSIAAGAPAEVDTREAATLTTRCEAAGVESKIGSLVIVPGGAADAEVSIRVVGGAERPASECTAENTFAGCIVARRLLRFVPETELVVSVALRGACLSVACDETSTCVRGVCSGATLDPAKCTTGCDESALGEGGPKSTPAVDAGSIDATTPEDGSVATPVPCAPNEKACGGKCVAKDDPKYGCNDGVCTPCAGAGVADSVCNGMRCTLKSCVPGYKLCAGNCVPTDAQHGCGSASCTPCESTNGTATCDSSAKCTIVCDAGSKPCGGRCVRVSDPTYGCTASGCGPSCQVPGDGTVVCQGETCVIGTCGAGTKQCGNLCVPTDANNGCETAGRCSSPCAVGEACAGTPTSCSCVPEAFETTCATKACGTTPNNCGQPVTCSNTCLSPATCGGGGAGDNGCGCTRDDAAACAGKACGLAVNNCGQTIPCGTCPDGFGCEVAGAGPNQCGCVPNDAAACQGKQCGPATNNCGAQISCGTCTGYNTCGGGPALDDANTCGCTPIPKAVACEEPCGTAPNGCGGRYTCGTKICQ